MNGAKHGVRATRTSKKATRTRSSNQMRGSTGRLESTKQFIKLKDTGGFTVVFGAARNVKYKCPSYENWKYRLLRKVGKVVVESETRQNITCYRMVTRP